MKYDRLQLLSMLHEGVTQVHFNKLDGSPRVMLCTLSESLLPERPVQLLQEDVVMKPANEDIVVVWDLDKKAWRSFRVDSVYTVIPWE